MTQNENEKIEASDPLAIFAAVRPEVPAGGEAFGSAEAKLAGAIAAEGASPAATPGRGRRVSVIAGGVAVAAAAVTALGMLLPSATPKAIRDSVGAPAAGASELLQQAADSARQIGEEGEPVEVPAEIAAVLSEIPSDATPDQVWAWADGRCADLATALDFLHIPPGAGEMTAGLSTEGCGLVVVSNVLPMAPADTRADLLDALAALPKLSLDENAPSCETKVGGEVSTVVANIEAARGGSYALYSVTKNEATGALSTMTMNWNPGAGSGSATGSVSASASAGPAGAPVGGESGPVVVSGGGGSEPVAVAGGAPAPAGLPDSVEVTCGG